MVNPWIDRFFDLLMIAACTLLVLRPDTFVRWFSYGAARQKDINPLHLKITRTIAAFVAVGSVVHLVQGLLAN
jgi:hypothetical protein